MKKGAGIFAFCADLSLAAQRRGWRLIFTLSALEALAALAWLALLPRDAENGVLLGYSASRLALMGLLAGLGLASAALAWRVAVFQAWLPGWLKRALFVLSPLVVMFGLTAPLALLSLYRGSEAFRYFAFYERLLPFFVWLGLVGLQMFAWLACSGAFDWSALAAQRRVWRAGAISIAVFGLAALLVAVTRIGLTPDTLRWNGPGVALLEWQLWLAALAALLFLLFLAQRRWPSYGDLFLAMGIWLLAAGVWLSQPVPPSFFATPGRAPNFELYPFSDGAYYGHFAHSLLTGNGFKIDQIVPRPLYITLLAGFHALAGNDYSDVIALQTLLLAFFPVTLYFLGQALHSRPVGLAAALLAILRELTAILTTSFTNNASNSKLFFADLPTALVISLWTLAVVVWLKAPRRRPLQALLVGGGMGIAMLFRTQSVIMLPVALLLSLLALRWNWRAWTRDALLVLVALGLTITPWLVRNYQITGQIGFDDPKTQTGVMAQHYTLGGKDLQYMIRPDEDLGEFNDRATQGIIQFVVENPGVVARFISSHFLNSAITNLLQLPVRDDLKSPGELLMPTYAFWETWRGTPTAWQTALILLNLAIVALGVGAAIARVGWAGLAPLLFNLSYHFSNAVARNSGYRYLLPVDWVVYSYYIIGLVEIMLAGLLVLGVRSERLSPLLARFDADAGAASGRGRLWRTGALIALGFVALGSLPLVAEHAFPQRYPPITREALAQQLLAHSSPADAARIEALLALPGVQLYQGRALYPRFYAAGDGEPRTAKVGYEMLDFARTALLVTGRDFNGLVLLKSAQPPAHLPNASDVIVLGCRGEGYLDAAVIVTLDGAGAGVTWADQIPVGCTEMSQ